MLYINNAVYSYWFDTYNWDLINCGMNRRDYGKFLSSYVRSQNTSMVLNLNGSWGTGKTYFLKQLYTEFLKSHSLPTIYIDAWSSDFSKDPLLVIISEFLEQLEALFISEKDSSSFDKIRTKNEIFKNLWRLTKKTYNGALDIGAVYTASKLDDYDSTGLLKLIEHIKVEDSTHIGSVSEPVLGKSLTDNYKKQLNAIKDTRALLSRYSEYIRDNNKGNIIVLVDELDRCRPTYAIEMLEVIKHFFDIDNFIFIIATDTEQLSHSIKSVYGNSFDGNEYLSRFFNRRAELPKVSESSFVQYLIEKNQAKKLIESANLIDKYITKSNANTVTAVFFECSVIYSLSLRRLEQIFHKFMSIISFEMDNENRYFDSHILIQLLCEYEHNEYHDVYSSRKKYGMATKKVSKDYDYNGNYHTWVLRDCSILNKKYSDLKLNNEDTLYQIKDRNVYPWGYSELTIRVQEYYEVAWKFAFGFTDSKGIRKKSKLIGNLKSNKPNEYTDAVRPLSFIGTVFNSYIDNASNMLEHDECLTIDCYYNYVELAQTLS